MDLRGNIDSIINFVDVFLLLFYVLGFDLLIFLFVFVINMIVVNVNGFVDIRGEGNDDEFGDLWIFLFG